MSQDLLALPLQIQISIASGFAAYAASYAGLRLHHRGQDALIIIGIFSGVSLLFYELGGALSEPLRILIAMIVPIVLGLGWRACYRDLWLRCMRTLDIHKDDGLTTAWETLAAGWDKHEASQVLVYLKSGRELYLDVHDIDQRGKLPHGGLVLGQTGDVLMCVTEEEFEGETTKRSHVYDENHGARLTYIAADQIERLEIRVIAKATS